VPRIEVRGDTVTLHNDGKSVLDVAGVMFGGHQHVGSYLRQAGAQTQDMLKYQFRCHSSVFPGESVVIMKPKGAGSEEIAELLRNVPIGLRCRVLFGYEQYFKLRH